MLRKTVKTKKYFNLQNPVIVCISAVFCCMLWGSAFPAIKIGYKILNIPSEDSFSQILFAGIRFTLAGIMIILFSSIRQKKFIIPKKYSLGNILRLSIVQTVIQYVFFYIGLANTTGYKSSIIGGTSSFIAIIIASFIFKQDKFNTKKLIGCILGFAGIIILNTDGFSNDISLSFHGEGFILLSNVAYALSSSLIKKYSEKESPVTLSGYQFFIGGIIMIIAGIFSGGSIKEITVHGVLIILYLALVSALAYTIWGILLNCNSVSRVAVYGFMTPIFGALLSAVFLNEFSKAFTLNNIAAIFLVSAGVVVVNTSYNKKHINK